MARKRNSEKDLVVSSGAAAAAAARPRRTSTAARPKHSQTTEIPASAAPEPEAPVAASTSQYEPSHEEIARLAHSYWLARGCEGGSADEDWQRAERELRMQSAAARPAMA
jgi:DUF2934 family protein